MRFALGALAMSLTASCAKDYSDVSACGQPISGEDAETAINAYEEWLDKSIQRPGFSAKRFLEFHDVLVFDCGTTWDVHVTPKVTDEFASLGEPYAAGIDKAILEGVAGSVLILSDRFEYPEPITVPDGTEHKQ